MDILHFGIKIKDKPSNKIKKEIYLSAKPEGMRGWSEENYKRQIKKADYNFDLNMEYFKSLDFSKFNKYVNRQINKYKFKECFDLKTLDESEGVYMLVLDDYKQVYIGLSDNIKRRIMSHWNGKKSLERLLFGDICSSILSIDSFGALDTTRIFYIKTHSTFENEEKIVKNFDCKYVLNRTAGGIGSIHNFTDTAQTATLAAIANRKSRNFTDYIEMKRLKDIITDEELKYYLEKYPVLHGKM